LGHIQRGGRPTALSRDIALNLSRFAVELLIKGEANKAVGIQGNKAVAVDFETAIKKKEGNVEEMYSLIKMMS